MIEAQEGCQNQVSISSAAYVSEIRGEEDLLAYFIAVKVKVKVKARA